MLRQEPLRLLRRHQLRRHRANHHDLV